MLCDLDQVNERLLQVESVTMVDICQISSQRKKDLHVTQLR